jgi:molybdopterin molybdotransferase
VSGSAGFVSAELVRARRSEPPVDSAAMDGFAVRFLDGSLPPEFRLREGLVTSAKGGRTLAPGEAVAITTGAPLPARADAVVRKERALATSTGLRTRGSLERGTDVHRRGEDLLKGTTILRPGETIRPYQVGLLLAQNIARLRVRVARVTLIPIGDELRTGSAVSIPGRIRDSISPIISALDRSTVPATVSPVADRPEAIVRELRRAARRSDLIVTIGGTSVGAKDFTKSAVNAAGEVLFEGVRVNVLKRGAVGQVGRVPVVMLPGQVLSSVVVWHEFGRPILHRLLGRRAEDSLRVRLNRPLRNPHPMDSVYLLEVRNGSARPCRWGVRLYSVLLRANAYAVIPKHRTLAAGTPLRVRPLVGD